MDTETVGPALTPEEWARKTHRVGNGTVVRQAGRGLQLVDESDGTFHWLGDDHALAALALDGEPFGFTREDVAALDEVLAGFAGDPVHPKDPSYRGWLRDQALAVRLRDLVARIADLLPPE